MHTLPMCAVAVALCPAALQDSALQQEVDEGGADTAGCKSDCGLICSQDHSWLL